MTSSFNRRHFLTGRRGMTGAQSHDVQLRAAEPGGSEEAAPYLIHYTRRAMACDFTVYVPADNQAERAEHVLEALDLVDELETQMTVYRHDSELSRLNALAAEMAVPVEPRLGELLRLAVQLSELTDHAFDITSGPLSKLWGFHRREGKLPSREAIRHTLEVIGSRHLLFDEQEGSIQFAKPGVELNLGGIGKGYALDRCRTLLVDAGVSHFLMHGGQSSVLAAGSRRPNAAGCGWQVDLQHPFRDQQRLATMTLHDEALGTSGSARQSFTFHGQRYGHILDPRTGWPAGDVLSATVVASTGAVADALATACYVLGVEHMRSLLVTCPSVEALVVTKGKVAGTVELHALNMADDRWQCHDSTATVLR